jgi:hypothetical protein
MPSYLDFNSTKKLRDLLIGKTIKRPNGPQTFTSNNYTTKNVSDFSNVDLPEVDADRKERLDLPKKTNTYKPLEYLVIDSFDVLPRRANLSLYWNGTPYFTPQNHNLISIFNTETYDTESELFRLSASYIKNDPNGPIQARIKQNLEAATIGRFRLIDALNGNTATAINIVTGREPLIESNNKITVAKTLAGKGIDFLQTVSGVEFPFSEIPGDYLSNPRNPINQRPEARTELGAIAQDVTGALGSLIGIRRRPKTERKPSDLMIEYLGDGQKNILFDLLSYSRYAPNYTTTARSQNSSKLFNVVSQFSQGVKTLLGNEAPRGVAYIGDDRGDDVKYAMNDFNDRPVRSPYYLSLMFDPVQSQLFERVKNVSDNGDFTGNLTWISRNSKNKLGVKNSEWGSQSTIVTDSLSTNYSFRSDSILGITQELLDTMPSDGGAARSHIANIIDQTSRVFREGTKLLSRGSAIKYVDEYGGETGAEYCRVWTKDRAYFNYSDTMKRTGNIRKYDDSVLSSPWNINIAPMSNGSRDFSSSTNIDNDESLARKYMLSIENLAWKTSNIIGFTYNDLPVCERGPNGGRVMWFPPYDLTFSEQNTANWETNNFMGRPEPIYTYQNTERAGSISFKVVVDHPSILNLLVRELFKNLSDEETDNYINAFFAGCEDIDFYDLINRYPVLEPSDAKLIIDYLNNNAPTAVVEGLLPSKDNVEQEEPPMAKFEKRELKATFYFPNDRPLKGPNIYTSSIDYNQIYIESFKQENFRNAEITILNDVLNDILTLNNKKAINDRLRIASKKDLTVDEQTTLKNTQTAELQKIFTNVDTSYSEYNTKIQDIKKLLDSGEIMDIVVTISSTTSEIADDDYNYDLSLRRSHSIIKDIIPKISANGKYIDKWSKITPPIASNNKKNVEIKYSLKELGYAENVGNVVFKTINYGENGNFGDAICNEKKYQYSKIVGGRDASLNVTSPVSIGCRKSEVSIVYDVVKKSNKITENDKDGLKEESALNKANTDKSKPLNAPKNDLRDPMKKIITKTLSECYYFKALEESDPLVFSSLKEKLKYFHPAFHSTTPEGLNSRLTFLQQCIRPGDTIPVIGKSTQEQTDARNTSFGPPPICVLRVGDFYNTKIVIRNVNITFEENLWDLNPEGIGVQPMIAKVDLQINFIGGQGLREPVSRLQNALSSNFYANTEMYDERSVNTAKTINNQDISGASGFTANFLKKLQDNFPILREEEITDEGNKLINGKYIGEVNGTSLSYTNIVNNLHTNTNNYYSSFESTYNDILGKFGNIVGSMILDPTYRTISQYDVYTDSTSTSTINLFGEYKMGKDLSKIVSDFKREMLNVFQTINYCELLEIEKIIDVTSQNKANRLLKPLLESMLIERIDSLNAQPLESLFKNRNAILSALDKLNFVVKNEIDAKIDNEKAQKAELSGFTSNQLYEEYEKLVETIETNNTKMYVDLLPNEINFFSPSISQEQFKTIFIQFFKSEENRIVDVFSSDTILFDNNTLKKVTNKIGKLLKVENKAKSFNFKKVKRKNERFISYGTTESELTDSTIINELKKINTTGTKKPENNKLNNIIV